MKHIVSFSGGKDSTAMLLMMLEKKMQVDEIIFCDTGMEFPQMYEHIKKVEQYIGRPITILRADKSFEYYMFEHEKTRGKTKGLKGYGWPTMFVRWCTLKFKTQLLKRYYEKQEITEYIGIAVDEPARIKEKNYPLVDWEVTEAEALKYCYEKGFDWGGLYKDFRRVSCWCCPFKGIDELRVLYHKYPVLWETLKDMDKRSYNQFRETRSVKSLERLFAMEDLTNEFKLF